MRNNNIRLDFLKAIHKVNYARVVNFIPFLSNSDNLGTAKVMPYKLFKWARDENLIMPIKMVGRDVNKMNVGDRFYQLTKQGCDYISVDRSKRTDTKHMSMVEHETAKIDCLLAFIFKYPDFAIDISYSDVFGNYKPDAVIRMWPKDDCTRRYDFIFELERSRRPEAIKKEKFYKIKNTKFDLDRNFKILFAIAHQFFTVDKRPLEYAKGETAINSDYLVQTVKLADDTRMRFMAYHDFPNLHKAVWHTPNNKKVSLINS